MALNTKQIEECSAIMSAMSNEQRLKILQVLLGGEISVSDLNKHVKLSQSALSQHLAVLRVNHIVAVRRSAQTMYYSLKSPIALKILATLDRLFCANHGVAEISADRE